MNVYVRELARALAGHGVEVDIFTREHEMVDGDLADIAPGVNVVHIPSGPVDAPLARQHEHLGEFVSGMHDFRDKQDAEYRAVHSHYWLSGAAGTQFARDLGIPHLVTFHTLSRIKLQSRSGEDEPETRQLAEAHVVATADRIVAFSPHERDSLVRLYDADPARIELVPCGVDLSRFRPLGRAAARQELGLNGHKILLCVGRIEALKGVDLLIHTAAHLDFDDGLQVLVVGADAEEGREVARLQRMADDLDVGDAIEFVGRVPQEQLAWYYSAADVCVVPSYYESFGMAALESMACGTPVVASRVGGLPTIIQHGRTGYLKSWRCPEAFATSLEIIVSNQSLRDSMGQAARRRAEGLGWDVVAQRMLDMYDETAVGINQFPAI
jgi:D-inositol-3-phosphate glycosyltransferase